VYGLAVLFVREVFTKRFDQLLKVQQKKIKQQEKINTIVIKYFFNKYLII